jgi:outer membrane lipoprotein SlyB
MNIRKLSAVSALSALALLTACAYSPQRSEPVAAAPGVLRSSVQFGNVSNIDIVPMASRPTGGGAVLGAVIGAVIGNQIGSGSGRAAATGLGVVGGAVIGNNIENRNRTENEIYRVGVRYDNGAVGQFDYQHIDDLRVGDRVKVEGGLLYRV